MAGRRRRGRRSTQRGLPGVETRLVGRSRELGLGREALEALRAGRGGRPRRRRRRGNRQDASAQRAARARGARGEPLARGPLRLVRRVAAVLAVPRSPARRVDRRRRPRSPSCASASACDVGSSSSSATRRTSSIRTSAACSRSRSSTRLRRAPSQLSPEALQWRTFEVVGQLFARLARVGAARARARGSSLGRPDLGAAPRAAALAGGGGAGAARPVAAARARPPVLGSARARRPRVPASAARDRPRSSGRRRRRAARGARRARDAAGRARAARPRSRGRESVLPRGARPLARRRRRARAHRRRLALRPRRRGRGAADRREGDPRAPRPSFGAGARPRDGGLRARAHVRAAAARGRPRRDVPADSLHELQRLGLLRQSRRWPQPEYRFRHALIQETAYRTLLAEQRTQLHRRAAEWLEERYSERDVRGARPARVSLAAGRGRGRRRPSYLLRAGDKARLEYALDEAIEHYRDLLPLLERRGERQEIALVLFKLALALHTSLRFAEANEAYQRAFDHWTPPEPRAATERLRVATSFLPNDLDPKSAIAWPNIQACMQLFDRLVEAWPERTIVPSARRALGDLRRRPPLRLPPARGADVVRRDTAHGARRRVRHQACARSREPRLLGRHLLRARERRGRRTSAGTRIGTRSACGRSTTGRSSSGSAHRRRTS